MPLYSDFDLSLTKDASGDVTVLTDTDAVVQSVRNLVLTQFFERPFQPSIGANLARLLFEPFDHVTKALIAQAIKTVVDRFEPRAEVKLVDIYEGQGPDGQKLDDHEILVQVGFHVYNIPDLTFARVLLRRLR